MSMTALSRSNLLRMLSNLWISSEISSPNADFDSPSGPATDRKSWILFLKLKEPNQCLT